MLTNDLPFKCLLWAKHTIKWSLILIITIFNIILNFIFISVDIQVLREKQMAVSHDLEEKQTICQQLQTTADELEVQIDKLSEERHMVSSVGFGILSQEYPHGHACNLFCLVNWLLSRDGHVG